MKKIDYLFISVIGIALLWFGYNNFMSIETANLPETGQDMTIIFILLALAVCGLLLLIFLKRRKKNDE